MISVREGVLLSLVAHMGAVIFILLAPSRWFEPSAADRAAVQREQEPIRYVQVVPLQERPSPPPVRPAVQSDLDRRSATRERAPVPDNPEPLSRGNTPERVEGAPEVKAAGPESPSPEPAPAAPASPPPPDTAGTVPEVPQQKPQPARGSLGDALRNLSRYLKDQNYDNLTGGATDQSADIQFDSKGVDFGPWLRRFANQIRRNWVIPKVAELSRGRTVIQFVVLRNGRIIDMHVVQPAYIQAMTTAALNALQLSNPTATLPAEYPDDRVLFTVTFHYNENVRESP